jgi:hypothetical protein
VRHGTETGDDGILAAGDVLHDRVFAAARVTVQARLLWSAPEA